MKSRIFYMSNNLLANSINQVIQYLQTNSFTLLTKFWMFQVRKLRFCGIFVIFAQCVLWVKHKYSSQIPIFFFQESLPGRTLYSSIGGALFLSGDGVGWGVPHGGRASALMGGGRGVKKKTNSSGMKNVIKKQLLKKICKNHLS